MGRDVVISAAIIGVGLVGFAWLAVTALRTGRDSAATTRPETRGATRALAPARRRLRRLTVLGAGGAAVLTAVAAGLLAASARGGQHASTPAKQSPSAGTGALGSEWQDLQPPASQPTSGGGFGGGGFGSGGS